MTTTARSSRRAPTAAAPAPTPEFRPFKDFVGPARRRSDHPLVVGTIVLCLGITTITSIIQIAATMWAGSQVKVLLDSQKDRDQEVDKVRKALFKNTEASSIVLRRLCLNTAQTDKDRQECLMLGPALPALGPDGGKPN